MFYRLIMIGVFYIALGQVSVYALCESPSTTTSTHVTGAAFNIFTGARLEFNMAGGPFGDWRDHTLIDCNETHLVTGRIEEFGGGPSSTVHPPHEIGNWSVIANQMCYSYDGGGGPYCHEVWLRSDGLTYDFYLMPGCIYKGYGTLH